MKNILLTVLLLFAAIPAGAVKKFDVNPINLAVVLVEKADSANIESIFDYYGYSFQTKENGYQVMKHPNGSIIRYCFNNSNASQNYPTIIVKTKGTQKEIDATLKELKFVKTNNHYDRSISRYDDFITRCTFEPHDHLKLERIINK